jgi:hypothetical protein
MTTALSMRRAWVRNFPAAATLNAADRPPSARVADESKTGQFLM